MACIYHIYSTEDPSKVYIGQTRGDHYPAQVSVNEKNGATKLTYDARPMDHFSGLYSKAAEQRENPMFFSYLKSHKLNTFVVEIYTEANNFGLGSLLDDFVAEWSPNYKINTVKYTLQQVSNSDFIVSLPQKTDQAEAKNTLQFYLDAAEILHNYIAYTQYHKECLTYQIGGQGLSFTSRQGVVLNSTVSVPVGSEIISSNRKDIGKLQSKFNTQFKNSLSTAQINGKTFIDAATDLLVDDVVTDNLKFSERKHTYSLKSSTRGQLAKLFARYLKDWLAHFYNHEGRNFEEFKDYKLHAAFDNLFSEYVEKWEYNFGAGGKGSFTILDALTHYLAQNQNINKLTQQFKKTLDKQDLMNSLKELLTTNLTISLPDISLFNFIELIPLTETTHLNYNYSSPNEIHFASDNADAYGLSFRYRAYYFFLNTTKSVLQTDPSYKISKTFITSDETYFRLSMYRLSDALYRTFKALDLPIMDDWKEYMHAMLTIYSNNNGFTIDSEAKSLGIKDITGEKGLVHLLITNINRENSAGIDGNLAYQFSEETANDIAEWNDKGIAELEIF